MKLYFDDAEFDQPLQRTFAKASSRMCDVGEVFAIAHRIEPGNLDSWYDEWFAAGESNRQLAEACARAVCDLAPTERAAPASVGDGVSASEVGVGCVRSSRASVCRRRHSLGVSVVNVVAELRDHDLKPDTRCSPLRLAGGAGTSWASSAAAAWSRVRWAPSSRILRARFPWTPERFPCGDGSSRLRSRSPPARRSSTPGTSDGCLVRGIGAPGPRRLSSADPVPEGSPMTPSSPDRPVLRGLDVMPVADQQALGAGFSLAARRAIATSAVVLCVAAAACTSGSSDSSSSSDTAGRTGQTVQSSATTEAASTTTAASASTDASGTAAAPEGGTAGASAGGIGDVAGLDPSAVEIMNKAPYAQGQWAISVTDIDTGETVIAYNDTVLFEPASVTKTYSGGAAWQQFGPDSTVVTPVKRIGEVVDGTLTGNLVLVGQGDVTMGGRTKPDGTVDYTNLDHNDANGIPGATLTPEDPLTGLNDLAAQVRAAGITAVSGDVIVDDRLWGPHRLENGPVTSIIINQNVLDFTTTPGAEGQPATIEMRPQVAPWTVRSEVQTVAAGEPTNITVSSPENGTVVLSGTLAADSDPVVNIYAFPDPATFARTAFIEALGRAGVTVAGDSVATNPADQLPPIADVQAAPAVAELTSLPLTEELTYILKISYNLGAETMICRLAVAAGSTDCEDGMVKAAQIWQAAGLDTEGASLIDGSGLTGNFITAANQVQLQTIMAQRPDADRWKATLPILGIDGSLALVSPNSPAAGKVSAKTGTLVGADLFNGRLRLATKALGGYIDTASDRRFAFAIIATDSMFTDIQGVFAANDDVGAVAAVIQQSY